MPVVEISDEVLGRLSPEVDTSLFHPGRYPVPDFLIVGPQRTGSSWLRTHLCKHPQVIMPFKKEVFFFSHLAKKGHRRYRSNRLEPYCALFEIPVHKRLERAAKAFLKHRMVLPAPLRGEATASYATMEEHLIGNVFALNPAMRIVILVREPSDRAWSHAKKELVRDAGVGLEDVPFEAFASFYNRRSNIERGGYSTIIETWRRHAQPGAVHVGEFSELCSNPASFLGKVQGFLGIRKGVRYTGRGIDTVVNPTAKADLPREHRELLAGLFAEEVRRLRTDFGIGFDA